MRGMGKRLDSPRFSFTNIFILKGKQDDIITMRKFITLTCGVAISLTVLASLSEPFAIDSPPSIVPEDTVYSPETSKAGPAKANSSDFYSPSYLLDLNGDGIIDVFDNFHIYISNGQGYDDHYLYDELNPTVADDYRFFKWKHVWINGDFIVASRTDSYDNHITAIFTISKADFKLIDCYYPPYNSYNKFLETHPVDADNDGKLEFLNSINQTVIKIAPDGKINTYPLAIYQPKVDEDAVEEDSNAPGFVAWDYSMLSASLGQMFGYDGPDSGSSLGGGDFKTYDLNSDGLPDFINSNNGKTYLNVGNGSYYPQSFSGQTFFGDFNGDGISDYMVLKNLDLTCYITDREGGEPAKKTILSGFTVKHIWCKDVDKDGDIDVVMIVTGNNKGYGVVMENNGKGTFKRHEQALETYKNDYFLTDWDNDGNYELLTADKTLISYKISGINISNTSETIYYGNSEIGINPSNGKVIIKSNGQYLSDNPNSRPEAPTAAPSVTYEAKTGLVKIAWTAGADKETPTADLTYSVRIGTEPGKDDIVSAQATVDGMRLTPDGGNVGQALQRIYDTSSWPMGKFYISVQTVDGNSQGSTFSPEATLEKTNPANEFSMEYCENFAVADTLTLHIYRPYGVPQWNVDDGRIIESTAGGCKVIFDKGGEKSISLTVSDNSGNLSTTRAKTLTVLSAALHEGSIYGYDDSRGVDKIHAWAMFDMDEDGTDEMYCSYYLPGSFLQGDKDGIYRKIPKMFNSHTYAKEFMSRAGVGTFDINRDGMCDIINGQYTGINLGDLDMEFEYAEEGGETSWVDFDNDGLYDAVYGFSPEYGRYNSLKIYRNDGDYKTFKSNIISTAKIPVIGDFNGDGLTDIATASGFPNYCITISYNNGDFTVSPGETIPLKSGSYYTLYTIEDLDLDSTLDIVYNNSGSNYILFGNGKEIEIQGDYNGLFDLNNDGYKELITSGNVYYISNGEVRAEPLNLSQRLYASYVNGLGNGPVDSFVLSNGERRLFFWGYDSYWSCYRAMSANFAVSNERPAPPANLRHTQNDKFVVVSWDHSVDKETPAGNMRYNISIKHKGAEGNGAYLFSPANSGKNGVRVPLHKPLLTSNCITIPIANIPAGDYEVMVQGVDLMHDQSDFSETYQMHIDESAFVDAPGTGEVDITVSVKVLNNTATDIDWDGGKVINESSGLYDIVWDTPGLKTITANGQQTKIMIQPAPDGSFTLPSEARCGDRITVKGNQINQGRWVVIEKKFIGGSVGEGNQYEDVEIPLTEQNKYADIEIQDANTAYITIKYYGGVTIHHLVSSQFSNRDYSQLVTIPNDNNVTGAPSGTYAETVSNPSIDYVTADNTTGKYKIQWTTPEKTRPEATGINVYRESSIVDRYELIASLPLDATEFIDNASTPDIVASRYVVAYELEFGRSRYSKPHQPVHVMLNRGAGSSWNLIWGKYEGGVIPQYRIVRGDSPDNLQVIAEVSGNMTSYTDFSAPVGGALYYAVEAVLSPDSKPYARTTATAPRSNVVAAAGSNISLAESIKIISVDGNTAIDGNSDKTDIQLMALISPTSTTFTRASWIVIEGEELISVDRIGCVRATGKGSGTATVRAMTIDGSGLFADIDITVSGYSGIGEIAVSGNNTGKLNVYPSPAVNEVNIDLAGDNETNIYIFSLAGRIMHQATVSESTVTIDCSSWAPGVYIVKTMDKAASTALTAKFIKQ